jgi:hypothetical protein
MKKQTVKQMGLFYIFVGLFHFGFALVFCETSWLWPVSIGVPFFVGGIVYLIVASRKKTVAKEIKNATN